MEQKQSTGIFLLHRSIQMHIFWAEVPKPCKKRENFQLPHVHFLAFSLSSLWNDLFEFIPHLYKGYISCFPLRGWPVSPHPPPSSHGGTILCCRLYWAQEQKKRLRCNVVRMCHAQTDSQNQQNYSHKPHSHSLSFWSAEQPSSRQHSLQAPAALGINEPKVHKDCVNV